MRNYNKALRSAAHKINVARGTANVREPGPVLVGQACEGCNNLNHHALGCQRRPKCCAKCCARKDSKGPCPYHQQLLLDLAAVAAKRDEPDP